MYPIKFFVNTQEKNKLSRGDGNIGNFLLGV